MDNHLYGWMKNMLDYGLNETHFDEIVSKNEK